MPRLLVVGDLCPDVIVTGVPARGGRLRFGQAEDVVARTVITLGGSAAITACAAAAAGADVALVAVVGDDPLGRLCRGWASGRGVDLAAVRVDAAADTGSSVILVTHDDPDERHILTHLGSMTRLRAADVTDDVLSAAGHVHLSSFFLHTAAREQLPGRLHQARRAGATVSLDTNDDPGRTWGHGAAEAIAQADVLFCNDAEALGLAGLPPGATPGDAVAALLSRLPRDTPPADVRFPAVVHKLGPAGAAVWTAGGRVEVATPPADLIDPVVDTVGAGDSLAGTVLAALLAGADWPGALSRGVAAGTLSTRAAGGVAGAAGEAEISRLAATLRVTARTSASAHRHTATSREGQP